VTSLIKCTLGVVVDGCSVDSCVCVRGEGWVFYGCGHRCLCLACAGRKRAWKRGMT
jgi:hypothetical protein